MKLLSKEQNIPILDCYVLKEGRPAGQFFLNNKSQLSFKEEQVDTLEVLSRIYRESTLLQRLGVPVEYPCFFFSKNKRHKVNGTELELLVTNGVIPSGHKLIQVAKPGRLYEFVYSHGSDKKSSVMKKAQLVAKDIEGVISKETNKEVINVEIRFVSDKKDVWVCNVKKLVLGGKLNKTPVKRMQRRTISHKIHPKLVVPTVRKSTADSLVNSGTISSRFKRKEESLRGFLGPAVAAKRLVSSHLEKGN